MLAARVLMYLTASHIHRTLPGLFLCGAVTIGANIIETVEVYILGQPYLEALVLAIIIGVAVRTVWKPGSIWKPGIKVSAKFILECAIVMLGASVSARTIISLGWTLIFGVAAIVSITIGASYLICRLLGLPPRLSVLIACGNSICGNSAIAAVAPVIGADGDDIASSISFTAVLGVIVVLLLPLFGSLLHLSMTQYGVLAGLTVYAVPQVLAATVPVGALSNQVGTLIKLVRVLMLGPVVLGFSLLSRQLRPAHLKANSRGPALHEIAPWFVIGFLALIVLRSIGFIPGSSLPILTRATTQLTTIAMAALGLGVDVRVVAQTGIRVSLAVTLSLIALGTMSYGLIFLARIT